MINNESYFCLESFVNSNNIFLRTMLRMKINYSFSLTEFNDSTEH